MKNGVSTLLVATGDLLLNRLLLADPQKATYYDMKYKRRLSTGAELTSGGRSGLRLARNALMACIIITYIEIQQTE